MNSGAKRESLTTKRVRQTACLCRLAGRPTASIAGYCGLFSFIPMSDLRLQIAGIVCGFLALQALEKNPQLSGAGHAWFGIVIGILGLIVSVLGIASLIANQQLRNI